MASAPCRHGGAAAKSIVANTAFLVTFLLLVLTIPTAVHTTRYNVAQTHENHVGRMNDGAAHVVGGTDDGGDFPDTPTQFFEVMPPVFGHVHLRSGEPRHGDKPMPIPQCQDNRRGSADCLAPEPECSQVILRHSFASSYGSPAVARYVPRCADVPNSRAIHANYTAGSERFSKIVLRLDATVRGRQFDRYAAVWLDGVELWRFTSAEPTRDGVWWTARVDVTRYRALFSPNHASVDGSRKLVMALDNLVNDIYTGIFNVTLTLDFYEFDSSHSPSTSEKVITHSSMDALPSVQAPSSSIRPISKQKDLEPRNILPKWRWPWDPAPGTGHRDLAASNLRRLDLVSLSASSDSYGWFKIERDSHVASYTLTDADYKLILNSPFFETNIDVYVSPHGDDEFYYAEKNPFREVRVFLDDLMVGIFYHFPVVYTGGMNPLMWRPVAASGAYNIEPYRIDITPFSYLLRERKVKTIKFMVCAGTSDEEECIAPKSFWLIDGVLSLRRFDSDLIANSTSESNSSTVTHIKVTALDEVSSNIRGSTVAVDASKCYSKGDTNGVCYFSQNSYSFKANYSVEIGLNDGSVTTLLYSSFSGATLLYTNMVKEASSDYSYILGNQDEGDPPDAGLFEQYMECIYSKGVELPSISNAEISSTVTSLVPSHFPEPHYSTRTTSDYFSGYISATRTSLTTSQAAATNLVESSVAQDVLIDLTENEDTRIPVLLTTFVKHDTSVIQLSNGCPAPVADEFGIDSLLIIGLSDGEPGGPTELCSQIVSLEQRDNITQSTQGSFVISVRPNLINGSQSIMRLQGEGYEYSMLNDSPKVKQMSNTTFHRDWDGKYVHGCWKREVNTSAGIVASDSEVLC